MRIEELYSWHIQIMITRVPTIDQSDMDFVYGDSDPDQSPRSPLAEVTAEDETQPPAPRPSSSRSLKRSARVCSVENTEDGDEEDCKVLPEGTDRIKS